MDKDRTDIKFQVDLTSETPIYEQIVTRFKQMISTGEFQPGDKVPAEIDICENLNVSRTTVRKAMDQLVKEGTITRHRGRGSFIAQPKLRRSLNYLYNFTDNMKELGVKPHSVVLDCSVAFVNEFIRNKLGLPMTQDKVFHLKRLRCADDLPLLIEDAYIPYYLCNNIQHVDFSVNSLYETLSNKYQLHLYHATESYEAIIMSKAEANLLKCKSPSAGFKITRTSHLDTGYVFEYTTSVTRADHCAFSLELYSNESKREASKLVRFMRTAVL